MSINEFLGDRGLGFLTLLPTGCTLLLAVIVGPIVVVVVLGAVGLVMGLVGALLGVVALDHTSGSRQLVQVVGHQWERSIAVEEVRVEQDSDWCEDVPSDAEVVSRREELHHRERRVGPDRDIYKEYCTYEEMVWKKVDTVKRSGTGTKPAPAWPVAPDDGCRTRGCRRPAKRVDKLEVLFKRPKKHKGKPWSCDMDSVGEWQSWRKGDQAKMLVGGLTGTSYCTSGLTRVKTGGKKGKKTR
jgi:hypothetical protein